MLLGFAELEPDGEAIGSVGILPEIRLGSSRSPGRSCRPPGWPGPWRRGTGRAAPGSRPARGLDQQLIRGIRVGRDHGIVGLEQPAGEGVVDLGEPILAVAGQEADRPRRGSAPRRRPGCRRPARSPASSNRILAAQRFAGAARIASFNVARAASRFPASRSATALEISQIGAVIGVRRVLAQAGQGTTGILIPAPPAWRRPPHRAARARRARSPRGPSARPAASPAVRPSWASDRGPAAATTISHNKSGPGFPLGRSQLHG